MNFWFTVFLLLISAVFAFSTGLELSFRLLYVLTLLVGTGYFWAKSNMRGLKVERKVSSTRAQVGDIIEQEFLVESSSLLPKLWLELHDFSDFPDNGVGTVFGIGSRGTKRWKVQTRCLHRGNYCLGPLRISSGDPFGLFRHSVDFRQVFPIVVYPATLDLPRFEFPVGRLSSEGRVRELSRVVTPNASGVREYAQGDGFGRIHWLSTARKGKFMVKEFDQEPSSETWLLLDLQRDTHFGQGPESSEEYAVTVVASIARRLIEKGRAVGLVGYGKQPELILPGKGSPQLIRILDSLALLEADGEIDVCEAIAMHSPKLGRNSGFIVVTASMDERWVEQLQQLAQKGVRVTVVLLEPSTFGGTGSSILVASGLIAGQISVYFVRQGCNLAEALNSQTSSGY